MYQGIPVFDDYRDSLIRFEGRSRRLVCMSLNHSLLNKGSSRRTERLLKSYSSGMLGTFPDRDCVRKEYETHICGSGLENTINTKVRSGDKYA